MSTHVHLLTTRYASGTMHDVVHTVMNKTNMIPDLMELRETKSKQDTLVDNLLHFIQNK